MNWLPIEVTDTQTIGAKIWRRLAAEQIRAKRYYKAQYLLHRCVEHHPDCRLSRSQYATILLRQKEIELAFEQVEVLLEQEPANSKFLYLKACILVRSGEHGLAIALFQNILSCHPSWANVQLSLGHALKAVGQIDEAIIAYRKALTNSTHRAEAYWSLANLKTFSFCEGDLAAMRTALTIATDEPQALAYLSFAMGKALEDRAHYDASFEHYQRGNALRHTQHDSRSKQFDRCNMQHLTAYSSAFFSQRSNWGHPSAAPIFIVGLPRSGSTLLEQMLASHSAVDGTGERPAILSIARKLGLSDKRISSAQCARVLTALSKQQCYSLGEAYLSATRSQRGRSPFFVDKMPNNYAYIGLIHLILPNAKVIDIRRHPMAAGFACYKQLFAQGQHFTYDLTTIAQRYRSYVDAVNHWDTALPGKVLRVMYENLVTHTADQVQKVMDHCELPYEEQCLAFHRNPRIVQTPSSQQVRQPLYTHGLEQWRHYEKHLSPLKRALQERT